MSFCLSCVLVGEAKIYKHPKAETLYLAIPSKVVQDSTFVFKKGDQVRITYDPKKKAIIVEPKNSEKEQQKKQ